MKSRAVTSRPSSGARDGQRPHYSRAGRDWQMQPSASVVRRDTHLGSSTVYHASSLTLICMKTLCTCRDLNWPLAEQLEAAEEEDENVK